MGSTRQAACTHMHARTHTHAHACTCAFASAYPPACHASAATTPESAKERFSSSREAEGSLAAEGVGGPSSASLNCASSTASSSAPRGSGGSGSWDGSGVCLPLSGRAASEGTPTSACSAHSSAGGSSRSGAASAHQACRGARGGGGGWRAAGRPTTCVRTLAGGRATLCSRLTSEVASSGRFLLLGASGGTSGDAVLGPASCGNGIPDMSSSSSHRSTISWRCMVRRSIQLDALSWRTTPCASSPPSTLSFLALRLAALLGSS